MIGHSLRLAETKLNWILENPDKLQDFLFEEEVGPPEDCRLDIDKAWHLIHFLLTGDAWGGGKPLCDAVLGGADVSDEDICYGPARYLRPAEVQNVAAALDRISLEALWSRFDQEAVGDAQIYSVGWEGTDEERDYILEHFVALKEFFTTAAVQNEAVMHYLG